MKLLKYLLLILHENILVFICATMDDDYLCKQTTTFPSNTNSNCGSVNATYRCYENIPAKLPPNVTRVELHCIDPMSITNETFRGEKWESITYLRLFWKSHTTNI